MNPLPLPYSPLKTRGNAIFETILVVAVLAGLAATITVGVWSYQKGNEKSGCIQQIAAVQRAVRAHQLTEKLDAGQELSKTTFVGHGRVFTAEPCCPATGEAYVWAKKIPLIGQPAVRCPHSKDQGHLPSTTANW